jgi:hypothetical protein
VTDVQAQCCQRTIRMHTTTAAAAAAATTNSIYCYPMCLMFAAAVMYRTDNDGFIAIDDLEMIVGGDHTSEEVKEAIRHFDKVLHCYYSWSLQLSTGICICTHLQSSCATRVSS